VENNIEDVLIWV